MKELNEVYEIIKDILESSKSMTEESFDKAKAFRYIYNCILELKEDLSYLEKENDLFDDEVWSRDTIEKPKEEPKKSLDLNDLM